MGGGGGRWGEVGGGGGRWGEVGGGGGRWGEVGGGGGGGCKRCISPVVTKPSYTVS